MNTPETITVEFTPNELRVVENALQSFISDFGHDEFEIRQSARDVFVKLTAAAESTAAKASAK